MFKNMQLFIFFDMFLNPSFKMTTSFANTARTTATVKKKMSLWCSKKEKFFKFFFSKFYNQIDGVAMGSPLAPVLANIFMGFHESKWLIEYNLNKPKFYLKYADDILAPFDKEQDSLNFLNFLNK